MLKKDHNFSLPSFYYGKNRLIDEIKIDSFFLIEYKSVTYLSQITMITNKCIRIKFIESCPEIKGIVNNQIWINKNKFQDENYSLQIIEILSKEHIRDLKIESIT